MKLTTTQYTDTRAFLDNTITKVQKLLQAAEDRSEKLVDLKPQLADIINSVPYINKHTNYIHKLGITTIRSWANMVDKAVSVLHHLENCEMELTHDMAMELRAELKTQRMRGRDEWSFKLGKNKVDVRYGLLGCVALWVDGVFAHGDSPVCSRTIRELFSKTYIKEPVPKTKPVTSPEVQKLSDDIEWMQGAGEPMWCSIKDKPEPEQDIESDLGPDYVEDYDIISEEPAGANHIQHRLGDVVYWIAFSSIIGYYWSGYEADAHVFTDKEADDYVANVTTSGRVSIMELKEEPEPVPEPTMEEVMIGMGFRPAIASMKDIQQDVERDMKLPLDQVHPIVRSCFHAMSTDTLAEIHSSVSRANYWMMVSLRGTVYGDVLAEAIADVSKQVRKDRTIKKCKQWETKLTDAFNSASMEVAA